MPSRFGHTAGGAPETTGEIRRRTACNLGRALATSERHTRPRRGLVVEVLWLDGTELEPPGARPVVNELQWIQLQLDAYANTAEVLAHLHDVRISRVHGRVHYLICDRSGACAAIELVGGRPVVSTDARVLTNHTFAASTAFLRVAGYASTLRCAR